MFSLQVILGVLIILFELKREKHQLIDILAIFNLIYFICYVIAPIAGYFMLPNWQDYSVMRYSIKGANYESDNFYWAGMLALIGYGAFIVSFSMYKPSMRNRFLNNIFSNPVNLAAVYRLGIVLFFISFAALIVSAINFGGIVKWIVANPRLYFDSDVQEAQSSSWGLDKATGLMLFSSYLFWGISKYRSMRLQASGGKVREYLPDVLLLKVFLVASFLLSSTIAIHFGGRLFFFKYFATFLIAGMYLNRKALSIKKVAFLVIFGGFVALYGRLIFKYLIYTDYVKERFDTMNDSFAKQFFGFVNNYTFAFYSASNNLSYGDDNLKLFGDLFTWPFQFLPSSFRPDGLPYTTKVNTFRLMDLADTSIIPSDILSYGIINAGPFGVLIVAILFGIVIKILNAYSKKLNNPIAAILFVALAFIMGFRVMYFDPAHLFKGSFEFILGLILVSYTAGVKVSR